MLETLASRVKRRAGIKATKTAVKRPRLLLAGAKAAVPAGEAGMKLEQASRVLGQVLVVHGPTFAYELGLAEPPKRKRTAPRLGAGVAIGAGAMYFLEPGRGREHREKIAQLVS
jgi:hypothetical protein